MHSLQVVVRVCDLATHTILLVLAALACVINAGGLQVKGKKIAAVV